MAPRGQGANTPVRQVRIDDELWDEFGEVATELGTDRSALTRQFYAYMCRRPGAKLPKRPEIKDQT